MRNEVKVDDRQMIALSQGDVHLWVVYPNQIFNPALLAGYRSLLDRSERGQEARFRFAIDRHRYLLTRALVRLVLSRYAPIEPHEWRFTTSEYGRPIITNSIHEDHRFEFNISHSDGIIVLAVCRGAIGIDVENIHSRDAPVEVAPQAELLSAKFRLVSA